MTGVWLHMLTYRNAPSLSAYCYVEKCASKGGKKRSLSRNIRKRSPPASREESHNKKESCQQIGTPVAHASQLNSLIMHNDDPTTSTTTQAAAESATQAWETTKEKASEALHTSERYVRDNPGTSVLSVFGGGLLLGVLIGWSLAREERDDYPASTRKFLKRWGHKLNLD